MLYPSGESLTIAKLLETPTKTVLNDPANLEVLNYSLSKSALCEKAQFTISKDSQYFSSLNLAPQNIEEIILEVEICRIESDFRDSDSLNSEAISCLDTKKLLEKANELKTKGDNCFKQSAFADSRRYYTKTLGLLYSSSKCDKGYELYDLYEDWTNFKQTYELQNTRL